MTPSNPLPVRVYVISTHALYNLETNYYSLHSAVNLGHAGNLFKSSAQRVKPPRQTYHFGHWPTASGIDRMRRRGARSAVPSTWYPDLLLSVVEVQNYRWGNPVDPWQWSCAFSWHYNNLRRGTLWNINWRWGTAFPCVPLHFNHWLLSAVVFVLSRNFRILQSQRLHGPPKPALEFFLIIFL